MKWLNKFSRKVKVTAVAAVIASVILAALSGAAAYIKSIPDGQQLANRWAPDGGYTQISAFYTKDAAPDVMQLKSFEYSLDDEFLVDGIEAPSESARLWLTAYSGSGKIQVASDKTTISAAAVGVGGDFFQFHPFKLLYGSYFSGSDLMQDAIIMDEDAAWQLFGSSDVAGMTVTIGGVPHYVAGVIERDDSLMDKRAGVDTMTIYLSYDSLSKYGSTDGISCYEMLLPNPVSGYGMEFVKEKLGIKGETAVLVENTERYSLISLFKVIGDFGTRSMQTMGIIWPGWENAARGWEDVLALILIFQVICASVLAVIAVIAFWALRKLVGAQIKIRKDKRDWKYEEAVETMD